MAKKKIETKPLLLDAELKADFALYLERQKFRAIPQKSE